MSLYIELSFILYLIKNRYNNRTFNIPNYTNRVAQGLGTGYVEAGLPDHTHAIKFRRNDSTGHHADGNITPHIYTDGYTYQGDTNAAKYASESNPIYGASTTVQPPATKSYWIIKY